MHTAKSWDSKRKVAATNHHEPVSLAVEKPWIMQTAANSPITATLAFAQVARLVKPDKGLSRHMADMSAIHTAIAVTLTGNTNKYAGKSPVDNWHESAMPE